jgi:Phytanoyl-CoA dioxygenase (PhyH)
MIGSMRSLFARTARNGHADALHAAEALEAEGRALEAIDVLTEANRQDRSAAVEARLVRTRHRAFGELDRAPARTPEPEPVDTGAEAEDDGLPAVALEQLTAARVAGALPSKGALIIRGLIDEARARLLAKGVDRAYAAREAAAQGAAPEKTAPWYVEFPPDGEAAATLALGRDFMARGGGGVWAADSPAVMFDLLESFEQAGVRQVLTDYLGGRPALSVNKATLRRARPNVGTAWWHQDGAFLGRDIRSLNVWLSLSHCGRDAPGLEVVPGRLNEIIETGTQGAEFDWSVGESVAAEVSGGRLSRPVFKPGDALLFDHFLLHRTSTDPAMTGTRYATETWFFAPSAYPDPAAQVPLVF